MGKQQGLAPLFFTLCEYKQSSSEIPIILVL